MNSVRWTAAQICLSLYSVLFFVNLGSATITRTIEVGTNSATTLSRVNISGYVRHVTIGIFSWKLTIAWCLVVGLGLGLDLQTLIISSESGNRYRNGRGVKTGRNGVKFFWVRHRNMGLSLKSGTVGHLTDLRRYQLLCFKLLLKSWLKPAKNHTMEIFEKFLRRPKSWYKKLFRHAIHSLLRRADAIIYRMWRISLLCGSGIVHYVTE